MMNEKISIGLVQMSCDQDPTTNLNRAVDGIHKAAQKGAKIVCLQELFRSIYFCQKENLQSFSLAETIPGESTDKLSLLAKKFDLVIIAPIFEKRSEGIYHNTAVIIDADGSLGGIYRKMHIPDDPCFYEKFYFTPGDTGFRTFNTRYGRVGVLICWDQWFPEAARLCALSGAQFLFYPTAIGFHDDDEKLANQQRRAWETIQRSHAIANGLFVASVNRVGREKNLQFWGKSFICDPSGEILAQASSNKTEVITALCDLKLIGETRQNWPFFRDRRIDSYQNLIKLYVDPNE